MLELHDDLRRDVGCPCSDARPRTNLSVRSVTKGRLPLRACPSTPTTSAWSPSSQTDTARAAADAGVQPIGARYREDLLLDAAQAIEDRTPLITPIQPQVAATAQRPVVFVLPFKRRA
jgi:hypothetical protein